MIHINNISFLFETDGPTILKDISLSVQEGEFVVFLGKNGSGKSTLSRLINALLYPCEGNILVDELDTKVAENQWDIRKRVQMVFQNPENQIVGTNIEEDIAFGLSNIGYPQEKMESQINWVLEKVGLLEKKNDSIYALSGGEKQKLAIASALSLSPKYLILDEATSMLDELSRNSIMSTVRHLKDTIGIGIIHITHHLEEILYADRVVLFCDGKIVGEHSPLELLSEKELLEQCGLEIPFTPSLVQKLKSENISLPQWPTIRELVNELWK